MIRMFKHYIPHAVVVLGVIDLLLLLLAGELAWQFRAYQIGIEPGPFAERALQLLIFTAAVWTAMIGVGSYTTEALRSLRFALARLLVAVSLGVLAISLLDFILPNDVFWRSILFYAMLLSCLMVLLTRLTFVRILGIDTFRQRVLVLGAGDRAKRLLELSKRPGSGFKIASFVSMSNSIEVMVDAVPRKELSDLGLFVEQMGASEVVLAIEERRNTLPLKDLLRVKTRGLHVSDFSSFLERQTGRLDLDTLNPSWLIFSDGFSAGRTMSSVAKRAFDIVVSMLILLVTLPLIGVFAVLVKLESRGPAFYCQTRIGLYGEKFRVIKLRSMVEDAEKDGARWAEKGDPRVTRIGRFIRLVRIDELPQVWSVLRGEMSFVGPRPERPEFVENLEKQLPFYAERHMVKPGITGWAQINYPYGASLVDAREKLEYDLYYAKNYSPFLDIVILLQTLRVILWPEGAR